ncbi:MAG: hypothetical protein UZ20_WS6002000014 [candidate division WS6 bacterium OLB21]|uniref:Resolvase/invertase-type recombinase catalytic domain-containing protein n=1 Tax=candidate division WS6 bacterium OLB21 TaxID=1617427 RepID=A0A136KLL0_9BACT|nr:MAG: hypothetical protein UZ20_WS6002000014 [candidate division WS6 bacterium OLB21]
MQQLQIEPSTETPRIVAYCRVSTNNQKEDGLSTETQKTMIMEKVREMGGKLVETFFVDDGKSGTNMNRPGLTALLARCSKGDVTHLVIQDTSRISRDTKDYLTIKAILGKYKIQLIALSGMQSFGEDPYSQFLDEIIASVNALHPRISGFKARQTCIEKFKAGFYPSEAPLGYKNIENKNPTGCYDKRVIIIDPDIAPFVIDAFKMYATRLHSVFSVRQFLHQKGVRGRFGRPLQFSVVHNMLRNRFYIGKMHWGGLTGDGKHTPLIDTRIFNIVQNILSEKGNYGIRQRKHDFLLRGIVFCNSCHRRYVAEYHYADKYKSGHGRLGMYRCGGLGKRGTGCKAKYITVENLEEQVRQEVKKLEFKPEFIEAVKRNVLKVYQSSIEKVKLAKKAAFNRRDAVEIKRDKLEEEMLNGNVTGDAFKRISQKLDAELLDIQKEIGEIDRIRTIDVNIVDEVIALTQNIVKAYDEADIEKKRAYLSFFFKEIRVEDKKIVDVVYKPVISVLKQTNMVILSTLLLPRLDSNQEPFDYTDP